MIAAAPFLRLLSWCGKAAVLPYIPFPAPAGAKRYNTLDFFHCVPKVVCQRGTVPPLETPAIFGSCVATDCKNAVRPHTSKMGTALRFCVCRPVELLFVGDVLRNVLQAAVQRRTQFVQRLCFHVVIGPQTPDGLAVDAAFLPKLVGGNTPFLHHIPQLIKNNHDLTP